MLCNSIRKILIVNVTAGLIAIGPMQSRADQPIYRVIDLIQMTNANITAVAGINNLGQITGRVGDGNSARAFFWNGQSTMILNSSYYGAGGSLNDAGVVVGTVKDKYGSYQGVIWQDGQMQPLNMEWPVGINSSGTVVGYSGGGMDCHGYKWHDNMLTMLPSIGVCDWPSAINNAGIITGWNWTGSSNTALVWNNDVPEPLDVPEPSINRYAITDDINEDGRIVGSYGSDVHGMLPCMWYDGTIVTLPSLPNRGSHFPLAINDYDLIVGAIDEGNGEALLWNAGEIHSLNTLIPADSGWFLQSALDVNNAGWIIGMGLYDGLNRPYLLQPIPEPTVFVMLLFGLMAIEHFTLGCSRRTGTSSE